MVVLDTPATLAAFDNENGILTPVTDRYLLMLAQLTMNVTYGLLVAFGYEVNYKAASVCKAVDALNWVESDSGIFS